MKDDRLYLTHILECITKIERFTTEGKDAFLSDDKTQDAVLRNLQIMAESTQRVSDSLKALHPEVPWPEIAGFRNVLAHDYLGVKVERVWEVIQAGLPRLKASAQSMLKTLGPAPE